MRSLMMCAVLLATIASAAEQPATPELESPRTFVGLVPLRLDQGVIAVDGERVLSPKLSAHVGVMLSTGWLDREGTFVTDGWQAAFAVEPGLRYYLTGTALDGLWMGGHLELLQRWARNTVEFDGGRSISRDHEWRMGLGALVGYSMIVARGLTVQAGVGLGVSYASLKVTTLNSSTPPPSPQEQRLHYTSWDLGERATLAVGWAF